MAASGREIYISLIFTQKDLPTQRKDKTLSSNYKANNVKAYMVSMVGDSNLNFSMVSFSIAVGAKRASGKYWERGARRSLPSAFSLFVL